MIINFPSALCLDNVPPHAAWTIRSTQLAPVYPTTRMILSLLLPFPYLPAKPCLLATSRDIALATRKLTSIPLHLLVAVLPE